MSQEGKIAFITGGLGGIGLSFGENLLQQGAKVILVDLAEGTKIEEDLRKKYGEDKVMTIKCDVTNTKQLRASYQKVIDTLGGLDIVINAAGIIEEINYEKAIAVLLTAVITSSYMAVERMRKDKGGRGGILINISSATGLSVYPYFLAYSASKAGVIAFGKSLVANLGSSDETGIKVGTICPTAVATAIFEQMANLKLRKLRETDVTQPYLNEQMAFIKKIVDDAENMMSCQRMSEALLKYLSHPDLHGSVLEVQKEYVQFDYPDTIRGNKIEINTK